MRRIQEITGRTRAEQDALVQAAHAAGIEQGRRLHSMDVALFAVCTTPRPTLDKGKCLAKRSAEDVHAMRSANKLRRKLELVRQGITAAKLAQTAPEDVQI